MVIRLDDIEPALIKYRQGMGILGMIFAILGGVAWFIQQNVIAIILWGSAGLILLKLNKRNRSIRKHKNKLQ
ncbi:MAG: hypothetical protein ACJ71J_05515 [Nitrososphaeraceae archaeon]